MADIRSEIDRVRRRGVLVGRVLAAVGAAAILVHYLRLGTPWADVLLLAIAGSCLSDLVEHLWMRDVLKRIERSLPAEAPARVVP